jgi:isoquinoline 1-oxidoreductase beta subunit
VLGKPIRRRDIPSKVNGTAQFGIDVHLPGMLYASVERSPSFGASPKSVNDARAKAAPGVRRVSVLEWSDEEKKLIRPASGVAVVADHYWQALSARRLLAVEWAEGPASPLDSPGITAKFASLAAQPGVQARAQGDAAAALSGASKRIDAV